MKYIISILLSITIVKYIIDVIIYYRAWLVEKNGVKLDSDKDIGLYINKKTGKSTKEIKSSLL